MRSVMRVLLAVVLLGFPVVCLSVVAVGWWRSGEPPDWPFHLWPAAAAGQFVGGLTLAMVGGIVIGTRRWPERVWPHLLQLWGAGLIIEAALQMMFMVAVLIAAMDIDDVYDGYPRPFLWTVAVLAVVVTPALVVWRTRVLLRGPKPTFAAVGTKSDERRGMK
jgi:hypothetical protein